MGDNQKHGQDEIGNEEETTGSLAQKLYLIAKLKGITQDRLAKKCKVSRITINRFFKGKTDLRSSDLIELMQFLGIPITELIDKELEELLNTKSQKKTPKAISLSQISGSRLLSTLPLPQSSISPLSLYAKTADET